LDLDLDLGDLIGGILFPKPKPTKTSSSISKSTSSAPLPSSTSTTPVSPTKLPPDYTYGDSCGHQNGGLVCAPTNQYGPCCSQYGYCGSTKDYCAPENNCQSGCSSDIPSESSSTSPTPTSGYSDNEFCGTKNNGLKCNPNGAYGSCCSKDGMCGLGDQYCLPSNRCQSGCAITTEPKLPSCGDNICDVRSETCYSCPEDCGTCDLTYIDNCKGFGKIALTFDDGMSDFAPVLLESANKLGVKLTHFVIGNKLNTVKYQKFLKDFFAAGHIIASHTFTHPYITHLTDAELRQEMIKTDDAIFSIIGVRPLFMRNPYSDTNKRTMALLQSMGYYSIFTSLDTEDTVYYESNPSKILSNVVSALNKKGTSYKTNSFVITQHETLSVSINYLPQIVAEIKKHNYTMPLIHECLNVPSPYRKEICGDGTCSKYLENCATCPQDCKACPQ